MIDDKKIKNVKKCNFGQFLDAKFYHHKNILFMLIYD